MCFSKFQSLFFLSPIASNRLLDHNIYYSYLVDYFLFFLGSNEPIGDKWFGTNGKKGDELRPLFMVVNYLSYSHSIVEGGFDEMS